MKLLLPLGAATLIVAGLVGAGSMTVSAVAGQQNGERAQSGPQNGQGRSYGKQSSLESRAAILGMSAEQLQKALESKTMSEIALEKGLDETTFRTKMTEAAKARWEERGLTADEIAKRVTEREQRQTANADCEFGSGDGERHNYRQNR